ncbi:hypothetical protein JRO89_XS11G0009800 [Xanthoceras sorbifolium]|uniref:Uncharacterized protein n=1 Tax=Xanthoceras sorbifolium TaxID=99658 RepID=A0ABQ8HE74_9ROSI|nr:hypothetical protein JRO89_XS11G0009800 [Xanthoceras sorbifolium]
MQPDGVEPVHGGDHFVGTAFEYVLQQGERAEAMPLWRGLRGGGSDMQPDGVEPVHGGDHLVVTAFEYVLQQGERAEAMLLWVAMPLLGSCEIRLWKEALIE